jgi:hypothetical protein
VSTSTSAMGADVSAPHDTTPVNRQTNNQRTDRQTNNQRTNRQRTNRQRTNRQRTNRQRTNRRHRTDRQRHDDRHWLANTPRQTPRPQTPGSRSQTTRTQTHTHDMTIPHVTILQRRPSPVMTILHTDGGRGSVAKPGPAGRPRFVQFLSPMFFHVTQPTGRQAHGSPDSHDPTQPAEPRRPH